MDDQQTRALCARRTCGVALGAAYLHALVNLRVERDLERSARRVDPMPVQEHFPDSSSRALL